MKKLKFKQKGSEPHWVGDGFPVRTVFSYHDDAQALSPFLMMDYAEPYRFEPSAEPRGVGEHPHRGFETVTIVYAGEVEHRDSHGGGGKIGPGDVQWMTAGSGLVHEEMHGKEFTRSGGDFEMIQLWVNLPKKHKMTKPKYQGIVDAEIPKVTLANGAGTLRVIAGEFDAAKGPASTHTPVNLWDLKLEAGKAVRLPIGKGHTANVFVLDGELNLPDGQQLAKAELGSFEASGDALEFTATRPAKVLVLTGEPIAEPVVGYGPFVMNTAEEIQQAVDDFRRGKMGRLPV